MLLVRLKQCETALAGGRLEEAASIAAASDVRSHRQGQELIGKISKALLDRSKKHLEAGSLTTAASDCDLAGQLGGNMADVIALRRTISTAMATQRKASQMRDQAVATARHYADQGQLSIGQKLASETSQLGERGEMLRYELAARRAAMESELAKAKTSLASDDWEGALLRLARLDAGTRDEPTVREMIRTIDARVHPKAATSFEAGDVTLASTLLDRLGRFPYISPEAQRVSLALSQCNKARIAIESNDLPGAELALKSVQSNWPKAKWIGEAIAHLSDMRQASDALRSGPLGSIQGGSGQTTAPAYSTTPRQPPVLPPAPKMNGSDLNLALHVDGVGGFRVIDRAAVSIGPARSSGTVDLPLLTDASTPTITILRSEDDYFLQSPMPVTVNDQPVTSKLLSSGDKIALNPRCRFVFRRPSVASGTAILDLSSARMAHDNLRQVILLDRELIVGPGAAAHVRCDDLKVPAVIQKRDGTLVCRYEGQTDRLSPGVSVRIGSVGLVIGKEA